MGRRTTTDADRDRGQRIKAAYEAAGFSRKQIAEAIGRYYHDVMRIEDGQKPDPETLCQIAELCGVTERFLVRGSQYSPLFTLWVTKAAPPDLHFIERELLGSISFPAGHHPGPDWYGVALSAWRSGTKRSLLEKTRGDKVPDFQMALASGNAIVGEIKAVRPVHVKVPGWVHPDSDEAREEAHARWSAMTEEQKEELRIAPATFGFADLDDDAEEPVKSPEPPRRERTRASPLLNPRQPAPKGVRRKTQT